MLLRDALRIERTTSAELMQALPARTPPPSLEQGKGVTIDAYA